MYIVYIFFFYLIYLYIYCSSKFYEVQLKLMQEQTHIMTFGIYGNYYEKASAAMKLKVGYTAVMMVLIFFILKFFIKFQ